MTNMGNATTIAQLRDLDREVRTRAAIELGTAPVAGSLEALLEALTVEPDAFVRETITWAIVRHGDAVGPAAALLADPRPLVRHDAAHVLGKIGDPAAVDALIAALADDDVKVVTKAAYSLGRIGDVRAVPALITLVGHPSRELQSTLVTVLEGFGPAAVPALRVALGSADAAVREQAADILRVAEDVDAVPLLRPLLADGEWKVRFAAAHAMGTLDAGAAAADLAVLAGDPDARVRSMAKAMAPRA